MFIVIVVGVVVGVVVEVTRHHRHGSTSVSSTPIMNDSSLATVAFEDEDNITQYRLYYQDNNSIIKESAWNATAGVWYTSNSNITIGKAGTPIAAARSVGSSSPVSFESRTRKLYEAC